MRRFRWLCLALLPVLAVAGNRDDYARQWPLQLAEEGAGAYRVELDEAVYRTAIDPRLGDVEVFDAAGVALPAAVTVAAPPARAEPRVQPLPWFPLPAPVPTVGGGDLRLVVERDDNGSVRRIEADAGGGTAAGGGAAQWLVDATGLAEAPRALLLEWESPEGPMQVGYRVEGSDDLRRWRTLNAGTTLLDLQRDGQRLREGRIALDGPARYLRLVPLRAVPGPVLTAVKVELPPPAVAAQWRWLALEVGRRGVDENGREIFEFELPGRFPVERVDVELPGNAAVQWTLQSRDSDEASWTWRAGPWMAYRLADGARSAPRPLAAVVRDRHWRLTAASPVGAVAPVLRLGYRPEEVVFLAQGSPPYALAAGSARARREDAPIPSLLDALRRQRGADWQAAQARLAAEPQELAGAAALQPRREIDWKGMLLWGLLIGGAVLVALLGLSLLRQPPARG